LVDTLRSKGKEIEQEKPWIILGMRRNTGAEDQELAMEGIGVQPHRK